MDDSPTLFKGMAMPAEKAAPFWLVWNPAGQNPRRRHETETSATMEAALLARTFPGETFIVMESVCARRVGGMQQLDMRPAADNLGEPR